MAGCGRGVLVWLLVALVIPTAAAQQTTQGSATAELWRPGDPGERLFLRGRVVGRDGRPLGGALIDLWHADGNGAYQEDRFRARLETAADGAFNVATVLPGQYWGVKHIHINVSHAGYPPLDTRIVFRGDPNLGQAGGRDLAIVLEEVHKNGAKVLVGDVELVLGAGTGG